MLLDFFAVENKKAELVLASKTVATNVDTTEMNKGRFDNNIWTIYKKPQGLKSYTIWKRNKFLPFYLDAQAYPDAF